VLRQRQQVDAVEDDAAAADPSGLGHEPHDGERGHALPATRLADEAHHLPSLDGEGHAVEGAGDLAVAREVERQALDREERHQLGAGAAAARSSGSTRVAAGGSNAVGGIAAFRSTSSNAMLAVTPVSPFKSSVRAKSSR